MKDYQFGILIRLFEVTISMMINLAVIVIELHVDNPDFDDHTNRLKKKAKKGDDLIQEGKNLCN